MTNFAMMSIQEFWPVAVLALLFFGGKKLPELARAMGSSVTQFKHGLKDPDDPKITTEDQDASGEE